VTALPDWLTPQPAGDPPPAAPAGVPRPWRRRRSFARRGAEEFVRAASRLYGGSVRETGFLQEIDARAKIVGLLGAVVTATFLHRMESLLLALGAGLALALFSRIPLRRYAGAWLAIPFFSALMMLPATTNWVTPGHPVWSIGRFPAGTLRFAPRLTEFAVTAEGLGMGARFVLRTMVCVSFLSLLTASASSLRLLKGLRALGVPVTFIAALRMMERYLAAIAQSAEEIHLAKMSRTIRAGSIREDREWVASGVGSLFRKTQRLGHEVFLAMLARGYAGEIRFYDERRLAARDWGFLFGMGVLCLGLLRIG
jgi:cobalt/nickel transport system permease protein